MGLQQDLIASRLERDDEAELRPTVKQKRLYVNIFDVDGSFLRDIAVPFGLTDTLGFGLMMLDRFHPNLVVLDSREPTDTEDAAVLVADRGPL